MGSMLKPWKQANPTHLAWLNDRHHMRFSEQRFAYHDFVTQSKYLALANVHGHYLREIIIDDESVGTIVGEYDPFNRVIDLGLMIGPQFTRRGYGLWAWRSALHEIFHNELANKVEAGTRSDNQGMRSICRRSGMVCEGMREKHFRGDDREMHDLYLFGITFERYASLPGEYL